MLSLNIICDFAQYSQNLSTLNQYCLRGYIPLRASETLYVCVCVFNLAEQPFKLFLVGLILNIPALNTLAKGTVEGNIVSAI